MSQRAIAYLISQYPAVTHTFILREIKRLRTLGMQIKTVSINNPDRAPHTLDADEMQEHEKTFYIKKQGFWKACKAYLRSLLFSPIGMCKGHKMACQLAGFSLSRFFKHLAYLAEAILLGEWLESQKITHVHVHFANPASTVALLASAIFPVAFSMTVHGPDEFYDVTLNNLPLKISKAQFIFCISFYTQSQLMKISSIHEWYKLHVVKLGIDTDIFLPVFDPVRSRPCQILCLGRLVPAKGQQILIAAFEKVIKSGKNARLRLVGGGPDYADLQQEIRERGLEGKAYLSGPLNPCQVIEAYGCADIFVLPSFAEGLPIVLMEAMSMEIPCIASCINGIPELIRHNVEGLLVAPSNVEQLAQTLGLLIEDADLRLRLGRAGRRRILDKYHLEDNVAVLHSYFENLLPGIRE